MKRKPAWLRDARIERHTPDKTEVIFRNVTAKNQTVSLVARLDDNADLVIDELTIHGELNRQTMLLPIESLKHWVVVAMRTDVDGGAAASTIRQSKRTLKTADPNSDEFLEAVADVFREARLLQESGITAVQEATGKSRSSAMRYVVAATEYVRVNGLEPMGQEEVAAKRAATIKKRARAASKSK